MSAMAHLQPWDSFFFFNDTATTEIYTLSLHDALPISGAREGFERGKKRGFQIGDAIRPHGAWKGDLPRSARDRKSTRLNSSHGYISYAVFCLKKKNSNLIFPQVATHLTQSASNYRLSR